MLAIAWHHRSLRHHRLLSSTQYISSKKSAQIFFTYQGKQYLIIVDRYTNWLAIEQAKEGSNGLINSLRCIFSTFGIPEELSSDGGPEFVSKTTQVFLKNWGVYHRVSSVAYPHSNCRTEIEVKTAKRIISENTDHNGG